MIKLKSLLKEGLFRTYTSLESSDFENFTKNYLKLNRKHVVKKKGKDVYGFIKGNREADWKWDGKKVYHDENDKDVKLLTHHFNMAKKSSPWT